MKKIITGIVGWFICCTALAQQENRGVAGSPVVPGPRGVYIFATDTGRHSNKPDEKWSYNVLKEEKKGSGFKKIASLGFPASAAVLEKSLGSDLLQDILQQRKLRSAQDLYTVLKAGRFDTLGIYLSSPEVMTALGLLYIDVSVTRFDPAISYRLQQAYNGYAKTVYEVNLASIRYTRFPAFKQYRALITDSAAMVTWYATGEKVAFASVYTNLSSGKEIAFAATGRQMVYQRKDTLFLTYQTRTVPGRKLGMFIRPEDVAGNSGNASDTVHLLSLNFDNRLSISHLTATDTLGSVWLKWDSLPAKAWYSGIEVLKSRFATADYMVIDTLPVSAVQYRDRKTISGNLYYYQLRPLLFDLPQKGRITPAVVNVRTKLLRRKIPAPQGLEAGLTPKADIRLHWLPNADLDIFAYYILRGSSATNMQVISPAIRDTVFIDSTKGLNTGTTYLYAVAAVDMEMRWSDTSAPIGLQSPRGNLVTAPAGIQARVSAQGVRLNWNDVAVTDASVTGYLLYRRKKGDPWFVQLTPRPVAATYYTDSSELTAGMYEYGCTAVDAWNHLSILSPLSTIQYSGYNNGQVALYPPTDFMLRNRTEGIEITLPATAQPSGNKYNVNVKTRYNLYRRLVTEKTFRKIGEIMPGMLSYTDRQVVKDQLYAYTLSLQKEQEESSRSGEKSIRRK
jgi:hypothetical protein